MTTVSRKSCRCLFVSTIGIDWLELHRIPNVQGVVGIGGEPYAIAYSVLYDFWLRVLSQSFDRTPIRSRGIVKGDSVRITAGMCEGQEQIVSEVAGKKARMYLILFNQPVLSTIELDSLELIL